MLHGGGTITSRAEFRSANTILSDPPEADKEASELERKRLDLGIGEKTDLTLDGEKLGDEEKISWTVETDDSISAELSPTAKGKKTTLHILCRPIPNKDSGTITVKAQTETGVTASIVFTVFNPKNLTAYHIEPPLFIVSGFSGTLWPGPPGSPGRPGAKVEWGAGGVGASVALWIIPTPLSVNFGGGVFNQEFDKGNFNEKPKKWLKKHNPGPPEEGVIASKNAGHADILRFGVPKFNYKTMNGTNTSFEGDWKCNYKWGIEEPGSTDTHPPKYVVSKDYAGEVSPNEPGIFWQKFKIANDGMGTASISKFGKSVERKAEGNPTNEQTYLPPVTPPVTTPPATTSL
jgi:hypothetical protein